LPPELPSVVPVAPPPPAPPPTVRQKPPARTAPPIGRAPAGLDRATWDRFRTGRLGPARTLDLHGMTAAAAHAAVIHFILGAQASGLRSVEIITGLGSSAGAGTLRREFPHWLASPGVAHLILAAIHPNGNPGATRLLLRRSRA